MKKIPVNIIATAIPARKEKAEKSIESYKRMLRSGIQI